MGMNIYSATFADGTTETRAYGKPLTHAWKLTYYVTKDGADSTKYTKAGFSQSRASAEKHGTQPKRLTVVSLEIVDTKDTGAKPSTAKTPAKPKTAKPFVRGEAVTVALAGFDIPATVFSVGTKNVKLNIDGAADPVAVPFDRVTKVNVATPPAPLSIAA